MGVQWYIAYLGAFTGDHQVQNPTAALHVRSGQATNFFTAQPMVEQRGQNGVIALPLVSVLRRGFQ